MPEIRCTECFAPYPEHDVIHRCRKCGGVFDYDGPPVLDKGRINNTRTGMWRFEHSFDLYPGAEEITLGEGSTPLAWIDHSGHRVGLKMESLNPTGSYKDRGTAVLLSQLHARGTRSAVEDSSGNAGASFAAYAARAGIRAKVYIPESASGPKRRQIEAFGADVITIPGPRSEAARMVLEDVNSGGIYASHAFLPFGLMGIATIAYELWEAAGTIGTVIAPVGHGGLLLGIIRGFNALVKNGSIEIEPYMIGVQAAACAPATAMYYSGRYTPAETRENQTVAEGVRVVTPTRAGEIIRWMDKSRGYFLSIEEGKILPAQFDLAGKGFYVEPTSALVWAALDEVVGKVPEPIILILTGSGLKYQPT